MPKSLRAAATLLVAALLLTGCGGTEPSAKNDLRTTCTLVRKAVPQSTYDARTNARFAGALAGIAKAAQPQARAAIAAFVEAVDTMVETADEPVAFIDAHVDFLGAGEDLNKTCRAAGAAAVLR